MVSTPGLRHLWHFVYHLVSILACRVVMETRSVCSGGSLLEASDDTAVVFCSLIKERKMQMEGNIPSDLKLSKNLT